MSDTIQMFH